MYCGAVSVLTSRQAPKHFTLQTENFLPLIRSVVNVYSVSTRFVSIFNFIAWKLYTYCPMAACSTVCQVRRSTFRCTDVAETIVHLCLWAVGGLVGPTTITLVTHGHKHKAQ